MTLALDYTTAHPYPQLVHSSKTKATYETDNIKQDWHFLAKIELQPIQILMLNYHIYKLFQDGVLRLFLTLQ
jgi:hypothetical protein